MDGGTVPVIKPSGNIRDATFKPAQTLYTCMNMMIKSKDKWINKDILKIGIMYLVSNGSRKPNAVPTKFGAK